MNAWDSIQNTLDWIEENPEEEKQWSGEYSYTMQLLFDIPWCDEQFNSL
jgi:hypothetical protein